MQYLTVGTQSHFPEKNYFLETLLLHKDDLFGL